MPGSIPPPVTPPPGAPTITVDGLALSAAPDEVWDLLLAGRRIWSFRPSDTATEDHPVAGAGPGWLVQWPRDLVGYLDGVADLALRGPDGTVLATARLAFGASTQPVLLEDAAGHPLAIDRTARLVRTFEARDAGQLGALMDALEAVLEALARGGVDAFPAYGTLLGAVRSGTVLGHDNDVDVGYVSRHTQPVDVVRESFRLQRELHRLGFQIARYSGGAFKVTVDAGSNDDPDRGIGLDVFAGFFHEGHLVLMGEIHDPFEKSWMLPLGEVTLEGRTFAAPAEPERLLAATYGPSWRVPDPAFTYRTSAETRRRLDGWFRGTRTYRNLWDRRYSTSANHGPWNRDPHKLARLLHRREEPGTFVLDIGCGRGQDAVWLANRGHRVVAMDYSGNGYAHLRRRARAEDWDVSFHAVNLLETRHVLAFGARAALEPGPRAILGRHVLDATTERGRAGFWRMARTVLGSGGRLYLDFMATGEPGAPVQYDDGLVHDLDPAVVAAEAQAAGGVVRVQRLRDLQGYEVPSQPVAGSPAPRACRMVVEWGA
ncbi:hypothetical protein BH11ACT8_BH11ACT8_27670 [soil metagenome]